MKCFLISVLFLILLSSCNLAGKLVYGYHNPKIISINKIYRSARASGLNTKTDFYFIDSGALKYIYNSSFPKVHFFNKSGDLILKANCFQTVDGDFQELLTKSPDSIPVIKHGALENELSYFMTLDGEEPKISSANYDYVVIIYWSEFLGKITKQRLTPIEKRALSNSSAKILVIKVNADFRRDWKLSMAEITARLKE